MSVNYLINRLNNELAQNGVRGVAQKCWSKILKSLYHSTCSIWYARNLDEPINSFSPDIAVDVDFLTQDKSRLIEWLRDKKNEYPWIYFEKEIDAAMNHDHVYLTMLHQGVIIGYVKIGVGSTYINDFDQMIEFLPGTAFVYDTFTLPEYRGKSLALFALNQASEYFKTKNFKRILCHIEEWNVPSIKTFQKAGFQSINTIRFIRGARTSFFIRGGYIPFSNLEKYLNGLAENE